MGTIASSQMGNAWPTPPESATRTTQSSDSIRTFYLGSTSYASVFAEEGPIPDSMHPDTGSVERTAMAIVDDSSAPSTLPSKLTGSRYCRMSVGQSIVSKLAPFSIFEKTVKNYFEINKASALVGPVITPALPQLRADLEQLASVAKSDQFAVFAEITRNTTRPLKVPSSMLPSEFHTLFTGQNLRWETLGLMLSLAGTMAQYTSPDDQMFMLENGKRIDKDQFTEDVIHAANDCITLCQVHGAVNDIMVWLIYNNMLVTSDFYGDNC